MMASDCDAWNVPLSEMVDGSILLTVTAFIIFLPAIVNLSHINIQNCFFIIFILLL